MLRRSPLLRGAIGSTTVALAAVLLICGSAAADAATRVCYDRGYEDLRARNVQCATAGRVYRKSLSVAAKQDGASVVRFRFVGLRWRCRAHNSSVYTWRCTASRARASSSTAG